jgi:nicotinamide-nucleotide amidase
MNEALIEDPEGVVHLEKIAASRGRTLHPMQRIQALRPRSATLIPNPVGTAPGIAAELRSPQSASHGAHVCTLFALPGPPPELIPMFERSVAPALRPAKTRAITTLVLHTLGLPESEVARRLGDLMKRDSNPVVGTTASGGIVSCRIRYEGSRDAGELAVRDLEPRIRNLMSPFVFGAGDQSLPAAVLELLRSRRECLVVAESCTGGLLGSLITAIPGSSDVFLGGWITYANEMKRDEVNVPPELIAQHGAVSEPVARAMASGALRASRAAGADHAISITGVAGPDGGTTQKPVGDVFIAIASRTDGADITTRVQRFRFPGDRNTVRDRAAKFALALLRLSIVTPERTPLLWEVQLDGSNWPAQIL